MKIPGIPFAAERDAIFSAASKYAKRRWDTNLGDLVSAVQHYGAATRCPGFYPMEEDLEANISELYAEVVRLTEENATLRVELASCPKEESHG